MSFNINSSQLDIKNAAPIVYAETVTPSDSVVQTSGLTRGIYVGTTGNVTVTFQNGATATFNALPVGFYWLQVTQVKATGTTATNLLALY